MRFLVELEPFIGVGRLESLKPLPVVESAPFRDGADRCYETVPIERLDLCR